MKKITLTARVEILRRTLGLTLKQAQMRARVEHEAAKKAAGVFRHYYNIDRAGFDKPVQVCMEGELKQSSVNSMLAHIARVEAEFTGKLINAPKGGK